MKKIAKSFKDALRGLLLGLTSGRNMYIALAAMVVVFATGLWLDFAAWHWVAITLCCMLVIALEMFNTALERLCDMIEPYRNNKVRYIKDMMAGAVLWACIGSAAVFAVIVIHNAGR